ncbi:MAG: aminotransferase class V-fold PLP-dependent enzyme [Burkholderiaceae bacterium]
MPPQIYLDSNASNAVLPQAVAAARAAMEQDYGNPSSTHVAGLRAKALLETVRQRAARVLGAGDGRLMFNSGATEGIHTAVLSALVALRERRAAGHPVGRWLVYGATEHKAVPESLTHWNRLLGLDLDIVALPVDGEGRHDLARLHTLAPETALLCTMAANNETGVISDLAGIEQALLTSGSSALWLVDGVQALGKLPLKLAATRIDYAPFSGHKLYAPKGIGLLYVRAGAPFTPLMVGGGQEAGDRSGTENMAGIAALGAVLAVLEDGRTFGSPQQLAARRDQIAAALRSAFRGLCFNTPFDKSLPTTLNFSVPGLASQALLNLFDAAGLRVSAGSACSSGQAAPSHVLAAMQLPDWRSRSAIRLSFGPLVEPQTIADACDAIARCGNALQRSGRLTAPALEDGAPTTVGGEPAAELAIVDAPSLGAFLQRHPDALLVDVRERYEHDAGGGLTMGGCVALNVPMASLNAQADRWLQPQAPPLVFICKSGQRAHRAAAWMRGLGHAQAWFLNGGLTAHSG